MLLHRYYPILTHYQLHLNVSDAQSHITMIILSLDDDEDGDSITVCSDEELSALLTYVS